MRLVLGIVVLTLVVSFAAMRSHATGSPEVQRVRAHIVAAEQWAGSRDLSELTPSARAARVALLRELSHYRERGRFPRNRDFPGQRVPYFVDAEGTRCAMAHLIEFTGDSALVRRVATTRNNARVRELAGDPELIAWLDRNGLSLEEAARIQPSYDGRDPLASDGYGRAIAVGATLAVETSAILLNLHRAPPSRATARSLYGALAGYAGAAAGLVLLGNDHLAPGWGSSCIGVGAASVVLAGRQGAWARESRRASIAPMTWYAVNTPGIGVRVRF